MIVFDLQCEAAGHVFEGWFGSSDDYEQQRKNGLLCCPICGDTHVTKAVMAPNVGRKGNQPPATAPEKQETPAPASAPIPAETIVPVTTKPTAPEGQGPAPEEIKQALTALAEAQAKVLEQSKWVGRDFADQARAMHYCEAEKEHIHGETSSEEAIELLEEGVELMPLPLPVSPPEQKN